MPSNPGKTPLVNASSAHIKFCHLKLFSLLQSEGHNEIIFSLFPIKTRVVTHLGLPMPSSAQLLILPALQRNLLFTSFFKTLSLSHLLKSHAIVHNSPAIRDAITFFQVYIVFCNYYAKKTPPYNHSNRAMGRIVLDLCSQVLDLLSNLGFCEILAFLPSRLGTEAIGCSLSGSNLAIYLDSSDSSGIFLAPPAEDHQEPDPPNGHGSPSPVGHHPSTSAFNLQNPTIQDLSTLAT